MIRQSASATLSPQPARGLRSPSLPVAFYLADEPDLEAVRRLDPDLDLAAFRHGERAWVVHTCFRLRAAGYPVELVDTPPAGGLVVFHAKHKHALARAVRGRRDLSFVGLRADNSSPLLADFEIVQNGRFADGSSRFAVPFWPQPGLLPREPGRGTRLERVGYLGLFENLHPDFRDGAWERALAGLDLEWVLRKVTYREMGDPTRIDWEDCRQIDALLAVRPREPYLEYAKPASKLVNAWRAGVPALIGPEYAFREIRRSDDDYLEVRDADQALAALRRLRADPGLYSRMVANGRARAAEFSFEAITARWAELLFEVIPARIANGGLSWTHRVPVEVRLPLRRFLRWATLTRAR